MRKIAGLALAFLCFFPSSSLALTMQELFNAGPKPEGQVLGVSSLSGQKILIIYNAAFTGDEDQNGVQDSLQVAQYYSQKRGVPAANLLGVRPSLYTYESNTYSTFYNEIALPVKNKLTELGPNNIDVLLFSYKMPFSYKGGYSIDTALAMPESLTLTSSPSMTSNPYLEESPTFGTDKGAFSHAEYSLSGKPVYLTSRIDSTRGTGLNRALELIDTALYAEKYAYNGPGYYMGTAYVDSWAQASGDYSDSFLAAQGSVINGIYSTYAAADLNIAYTKRYIADAGLPFKWEKSASSIGTSGVTYTDNSSALTAPRAFLYSGWYNYNSYKPVFEWLPGSVGVDLNSSSMYLHYPFAWGPNALKAGLTAVSGAISEPGVTGHPRPNVLIYYILKGYTFAEAAGLANPTLGWKTLSIGDPLYAPFAPKTPVADNQAPVFVPGYPKFIYSNTTGTVLKVEVSDAVNPEVVKVRVDYGTSLSFGQSIEIKQYYKRHDINLGELLPNRTYYAKVTVTDPMGNQTTSGNLTFTTPALTPYGGVLNKIPGVIELTSFDEGGEGIAYHDTDQANYNVNQPRNETAVDIYHGAPNQILNNEVGEWLKYSVNVETTGPYNIRFGVSGQYDRGKFHLEMDGVDITGPMQIPADSSWTSVFKNNVTLTKGSHVLKLVMDEYGGASGAYVGYMDNIEFVWAGSGSSIDTTPPSVPANLKLSFASSTSAGLMWDVSSDNVNVTGYRVYRNGTQVGVVTNPSYVSSNLSAATSYTFSVSAFDAAGNESAQSTNLVVTTSAAPPPKPLIYSFVATPSSIASGSNSVLNWLVFNATNLSISQGVGTVTGTSKTVSPTVTTTYTLTASNVSGTATSTATVYVASGAPVTYKINASAGRGGNITPSGEININAGGNQVFSITPTAGFRVDKVAVDGTNQGALTSYSFTNVFADHTIAATFVQPLPGDFNLDRIVNTLDFSLLSSKWNQVYSPYDLVLDGIINSLDFAVMSGNWGRTW
jgi:uncharacterized protein (TIGR03790 family)